MLKTARSYEEACRTFRWRIPERYNLAFDICDRQTMAGADGHRTALIVEGADGGVERYTFHVLRLLSNRLANVLVGLGIRRDDRVLLSLPAGVEAAVALLAVTKMGAVAVPVPAGLGAEPMAWRLADSGARAAIVAGAALAAVLSAGTDGLAAVLAVGEAPAGTVELWAAMERASDVFAPAVTDADNPALLFYPADSCGHPAGIVHAHRALPGNLPAVELALEFFAQFGDILWTSNDWMSFEGMMWALLPAWHHAVPVVAQAGAFEPERALGLMARHGVRVATLPSSHLVQLTAAAASTPHPLLRALATGPGLPKAALHGEVERAFAIGANEIWGSCETGALAANNRQIIEHRPGSPGRAVPGVTVEAVDDVHNKVLKAGDIGMLAASPGTPGAMLGFWGDAEAPRRLLPSGWMVTGWTGSRDLDGYLWPEPPTPPEGAVLVGGLRVRLEQVEAALVVDPRVTEAAVAQLPNGELKAFVVAASGAVGDANLAAQLQQGIEARRAAHEVPRRIDFVASLPKAADAGVGREELLARPIRLDAPTSDERWLPRRD